MASRPDTVVVMARLSAIAGAIGSVLVVAFVALQFGLFVGGISYRKDCLTADGSVASSWTFTWFAPIPYVFRPSQAGCEVHTGARVALNALGIFGFSRPTTVSLAKRASADTANPDLAYFGRLKASLIEYQKTSPNVRSLGEGQKLLDKFLSELADVAPTPKYQDVHDRLVALLRATKSAGADAQAAIAATDRAALKRAAQRIQEMDPEFQNIVREYNRLHATD